MHGVNTHGVILFAHGSRDPQWRRPVEAVAQRILQLRPEVQVRCAYLELCEPDLPSAAAELVQAGVTGLTVLPVFLGAGKHAREDLPVLIAQVRAAHPQLELQLLAAVGEDPRALDLIAQIALGL